MTLEDVQQRIAADAEYVPQFWREKYEADAARNWDIFYSINSRNFFKVSSNPCLHLLLFLLQFLTSQRGHRTADTLTWSLKSCAQAARRCDCSCLPPFSYILCLSRSSCPTGISSRAARAVPPLCLKWAAVQATQYSRCLLPMPISSCTAATSLLRPWS